MHKGKGRSEKIIETIGREINEEKLTLQPFVKSFFH